MRAYQDGDYLWNAVSRTNTFLVVRGTRQNMDFGGAGVSDIAVYCEATDQWFAWSLDGGLILWEATLGGPGFSPVPSDYNWDGISDFAVYANGYWYIKGVDGTVIMFGSTWGGKGYVPVGR